MSTSNPVNDPATVPVAHPINQVAAPSSMRNYFMTHEHHDYLMSLVEEKLKEKKRKLQQKDFEEISDELWNKFNGTKIKVGTLFRRHAKREGGSQFTCRTPHDFQRRSGAQIRSYIERNAKDEFEALRKRILEGGGEDAVKAAGEHSEREELVEMRENVERGDRVEEEGLVESGELVERGQEMTMGAQTLDTESEVETSGYDASGQTQPELYENDLGIPEEDPSTGYVLGEDFATKLTEEEYERFFGQYPVSTWSQDTTDPVPGEG